jgi:6-phosphogluconolactonase
MAPSANHGKGIIMLRSIGSVTFLALFMVACGGGGGASGGGGSLATYSIGGTVTGLTGTGLVLQTNAGDVAPVSKAGAFTFTNQLGSGVGYRVFVQTQPSSPTQNCVVTNGTGFVGTANVTTVAVACTVAGQYTVRGTVSGLVGSGLTVAICTPVAHPGRGQPTSTCNTELQVSANGAFTLGSAYSAGYSGGDYVVILQQPSSPAQNCVIVNASVSVQSLSDSSVTVSCPSEHAYVINAADNTLWSYSVDATTGALAVIGAPTATGASPHAIVGFYCCDEGALKVKYVYVANEGSNDVSAFAVDITTGALTAVPGSPFPAGTDPQAMALYGSLLFVANAGSDNVSVYGIDMSTGALIAESGSPVAVGKSPTSIVVDPDNGIVFVANHGGSNDVSAFYFYDLTPVPGSPFPAAGNPLSLALTFWQGGMFLYTANPDATNPSISGFSVSGFSDPPTLGAFSPLSGSPFPQPVSHYIATTPVGLYISTGPGGSHQIPYLYVTSGASILGYASDIATGALTALPGFPVSAGANAYSINIDPTNQFLYVANDGAGNISGFRLDASTGALTPMAGSPFPAGNHPQFIATF